MKRKRTLRSCVLTVILFSTLLLAFQGMNLFSSSYSSMKIKNIEFSFNESGGIFDLKKLSPLVTIKSGEYFNQKKIRNSLQNLYDVGYFSDIEVKIVVLPGDLLNVIFRLKSRLMIRKISFDHSGLDSGELLKSIHSIRKNIFLDKENVLKAVEEIRLFLNNRGYFSPVIKHRIKVKGMNAVVSFNIRKGEITNLNRIFIKGDDHGILKENNEFLDPDKYIPHIFSKKIKRIENKLKDIGYFFPNITIKKVFLNKFKTNVNIYLELNPGYKYTIKIIGIKKKFGFVTDIWRKKVFEKWAERESRARIIIYLRNSGFLNAEVTSEIKTLKDEKFIIFHVKKNERYVLGKIDFKGNRSISSKVLRDVISVDDLIFDRIFHLRINSIKVDSEVLKWFYYYKGFPFVRISTELEFKKRSVNLKYLIKEGDRYIVDSILFRGNKLVRSDTLNSIIKTRSSSPFVQRRLNEDIEEIRSFYYKKGFDNIKIGSEITPGKVKSILIDVKEGVCFKFGKLIVIGATRDQERLLDKLFPLKNGEYFNRLKVDNFKNEMDRSSIFSEIRIKKIVIDKTVNILFTTEQNKSKYLGFGIGYEERTGIRFTFEYQKRNFFNSHSTFSALVQLGLKERRGEISYETPYIFGTRINSSLKIWEENELYRSYKFNRYGLSESLVKKLTKDSYVLSSLSWYRTKLIDLNVSSGGIDLVDVPYDITALNFSYVRDKRDNPFLPRKGDFFSTDIKFALPVLKSDFSFIRFRWGYQKNMRFFKNGIFSFSVRNGFATDNVPITERFFGGGSTTFRGTRNDKLGSLDSDTGEPYGGNSLLLFNFEVTFPLYIVPLEDLYYSIFADFGNIYRYADEISIGNLQKAIGLGLRLKSSIGVLSFDIAYNIERRESVSPIALHLGIGNVF